MAPTTPQVLKVHQAIARSLTENGITTLFGLIGEANLYLTDSFVRECGGEYIAAAHESGAALMALGYSQATGRLGVCTVTLGPAMVNTVTALAQGVKASLPMLLLCGDTPVEDRDGIQNVPQRDFVMASGAAFEQMRTPETAVQDVATAIRRAILERRPVVLNMPTDFQWRDIAYQPIRVHIPEIPKVAPTGDEFDNAIGIIAAAKRPIILAGRGATSPDARTAILKLAERIGAPLATTVKAKDLFRGEPYDLGIFGTLSSPVAVDAIIESDCIIAFGASLNVLTTSHGTFLKGKRIVQVNPEAPEVGKHTQPDAGLIGDPAATADTIVHWLDEAEIPCSDYRGPHLQERIEAENSEPDRPGTTVDGTVDFKSAIARLDDALPEDRIVVTDGGRFCRHIWKRFRTPGPRSFLPTATEFGSIGLGLSYAIGASVAHRDRLTVLFTGDGGFMNGGLAEFNTALRCGANLIVILCNDGCYGAEYKHFDKKGLDPSLSFFKWPDFGPVAVALGGHGVTVRTEADWGPVEEAIKSHHRPLLIDIKLDRTAIPAE